MKNLPNTEYLEFLESLSDSDREAIEAFFADFDVYFKLSKSEKRRFLRDFEGAIMALCQRGTNVTEALSRLSMSNLGGFYARPAVQWFPLDDAAKIYPFSMEHGRQQMFRLSVYFKEDVVPVVLQMALTFTIKRFPSFATTLKKGFFWHYLDAVKKRFSVEEECDMPCQPIKVSMSGSGAFRLTYYKNRMSVEFFHVLTDGTGGMAFVKALAAEYLRLLGVECDRSNYGDLYDVNETPNPDEFENTFVKLERAKEGGGFVEKSALQLTGKPASHTPCRVLHFKMSSDRLREVSRSHGATVTAYLLLQMFLACHAATDEISGDINIQVPVNMRKYYDSKTLRNFSMFCGVRIPVDQMSDKQEMLREIARQLVEKSAKDKMHSMITAAVSIVGGIRFIPLFIKDPLVRLVYSFMNEKSYTTTLSNLGVVTMPEPYARHIECMDFCLSAPAINRVACSAVTFGGTTVFTVCKMTSDPTFEEKIYQYFTDDGIEIEVEGSEYYAY